MIYLVLTTHAWSVNTRYRLTHRE